MVPDISITTAPGVPVIPGTSKVTKVCVVGINCAIDFGVYLLERYVVIIGNMLGSDFKDLNFEEVYTQYEKYTLIIIVEQS